MPAWSQLGPNHDKLWFICQSTDSVEPDAGLCKPSFPDVSSLLEPTGLKHNYKDIIITFTSQNITPLSGEVDKRKRTDLHWLLEPGAVPLYLLLIEKMSLWFCLVFLSAMQNLTTCSVLQQGAPHLIRDCMKKPLSTVLNLPPGIFTTCFL